LVPCGCSRLCAPVRAWVEGQGGRMAPNRLAAPRLPLHPCPLVHAAAVPPSLVPAGQHDRIVPPSKSENLAADMPHARLTILSGCGHLSHEEVPGALLEQLVPFCGDILTAAAAAGVQTPPPDMAAR
jgi:pimeloyl-ACP methyl ester carboxylesterase